MPNALTKDLEIMFEKAIEGFDSACVISREAVTSFPDATAMQRSNDVFYRPQQYRSTVVQGVDISAQADTDIIQRQVPSVFRTPDNVRYTLTMLEARDPDHLTRMGEAAAIDLAASVDRAVYTTVANQGAIVVKKVGALTWDDGGLAEATMISRGIGPGRARKLFMNPFDYRDIAKDLGNKAYMGDLSKDAYIRSQVPDIAGFKTFRTDNVVNLAAIGTVSGITVSGNQSFTPTAMTGDLPTDNRQMTLVVAGANLANTKNGDSFTIANINALHQVDKGDTGIPMTFRIISGAGTANLVISPAIIVAGPYRNCSVQAAAGAAITFLNTVTKPVNPFFADGVLTLDYGSVYTHSGGGVDWMSAKTKNGVPIAMGITQGLMPGTISVRCVIRYATTLLDREQAGIIIANQT